MLFNSLQFLYFFVVVTSLYFILPHKFRWVLLLAASCYFYMMFVPVYILILGFTIVVDYFAGIYIEKSQGKKRRFFLIASLVANIGVLAVFKYYNFINSNLSLLFHSVNVGYHLPFLTILLPIGLSFHTFQAMSYTIEVYRGNHPAERHFGIYSLYVMFYPQLVAGPIERPQNLLYQFRRHHEFDYQRIADGLKLMAWGFFQKVVIADRLALDVNEVYNNPYRYHGLSYVIATIFFAFQILCDFSGYTDIAIGAAKVMGFTLMKNFNNPYYAKTVEDFWHRWHMSLSKWFRDYLYISLGGNRVSIPRWYFNLMIVFLISGLWHGANWTYIVWGALNGFYIVFGIITKNTRNKIVRFIRLDKLPKLYGAIQVVITFILIATSWVFFRADTVSDGFHILKSAYTDTYADLLKIPYDFQFGKVLWYNCVTLIVLLEVINLIKYRVDIISYLSAKPRYIRWCVYYVFIFIIILGSTSNHSQFIYFQF